MLGGEPRYPSRSSKSGCVSHTPSKSAVYWSRGSSGIFGVERRERRERGEKRQREQSKFCFGFIGPPVSTTFALFMRVSYGILHSKQVIFTMAS